MSTPHPATLISQARLDAARPYIAMAMKGGGSVDDCIRAAIAAADQVGWQPIETAKRDGEPMLLWNGNWCGVGYYHEPNYEGDPPWVDEHSEYIEPPPTHWRPLPPAPAEAAP